MSFILRLLSKGICPTSTWDLVAFEQVTSNGFPILRRIARNAAERKVDQRVVFGFGYQTAPQLVTFLQKAQGPLGNNVTGVRYSGELGHPFMS